jgi:hypothetical protein
MAATESLPIPHLSLITGGVLRDGGGGRLDSDSRDRVERSQLAGAQVPVAGGGVRAHLFRLR